MGLLTQNILEVASNQTASKIAETLGKSPPAIYLPPLTASCSSPSGKATWLGKLFLDRVTVSNWEARPNKDSSSSTSPLWPRSDFEVVKGFPLSGAISLLESFRHATVLLSRLNTRARVLALFVLEVRRVVRFCQFLQGPGGLCVCMLRVGAPLLRGVCLLLRALYLPSGD